MFRWSVLAVALIATAPSIWAAFGDQTATVESALIHYLVAVPIVALLMGVLRWATKPNPRNAAARQKRSPQRQA